MTNKIGRVRFDLIRFSLGDLRPRVLDAHLKECRTYRSLILFEHRPINAPLATDKTIVFGCMVNME